MANLGNVNNCEQWRHSFASSPVFGNEILILGTKLTKFGRRFKTETWRALEVELQTKTATNTISLGCSKHFCEWPLDNSGETVGNSDCGAEQNVYRTNVPRSTKVTGPAANCGGLLCETDKVARFFAAQNCKCTAISREVSDLWLLKSTEPLNFEFKRVVACWPEK